MGCIQCRIPIKLNKNRTQRTKTDIKSNVNNSQINCNSDSSYLNLSNVKPHIIRKSMRNLQDEYEILEQFGKGATGSVFKVLHKNLNQHRALKVVKRELLKNKDGDIQFLGEIELLKFTDHPNIIKIYDYYDDDVNFYVITEFISGGELYDYLIQWEEFDEKKAENILYQLMCALNYLHSTLGIVHRDIKPENILVEDNQVDSSCIRIKLIDFGTGNIFTNKTKFSLKVGTPYYIAPEVLYGDYDEKVDIWSCGVIFYMLLVGYAPFSGKGITEILNKVKKGKYDITGTGWNKISNDAKDLVTRMLEYDPRKRISAEEALCHPFLIKVTKLINSRAESKLSGVLINLKNFNAKEKLSQATLSYIVYYTLESNQIEDLMKVFQSLDKNSDGRLTFDELKEGYEKVFGNYISDIQIKQVIESIDQNLNGYIEYGEFLSAACNRRNLISDENLKQAFNKFDLNQDGKLSKNEIIEILGTIDNEYVIKLISMLDENKDGEIGYDEFSVLMKRLVESQIRNCKTTIPNKVPLVPESKVTVNKQYVNHTANLDKKENHEQDYLHFKESDIIDKFPEIINYQEVDSSDCSWEEIV